MSWGLLPRSSYDTKFVALTKSLLQHVWLHTKTANLKFSSVYRLLNSLNVSPFCSFALGRVSIPVVASFFLYCWAGFYSLRRPVVYLVKCMILLYFQQGMFEFRGNWHTPTLEWVLALEVEGDRWGSAEHKWPKNLTVPFLPCVTFWLSANNFW